MMYESSSGNISTSLVVIIVFVYLIWLCFIGILLSMSVIVSFIVSVVYYLLFFFELYFYHRDRHT